MTIKQKLESGGVVNGHWPLLGRIKKSLPLRQHCRVVQESTTSTQRRGFLRLDVRYHIRIGHGFGVVGRCSALTGTTARKILGSVAANINANARALVAQWPFHSLQLFSLLRCEVLHGRSSRSPMISPTERAMLFLSYLATLTCTRLTCTSCVDTTSHTNQRQLS